MNEILPIYTYGSPILRKKTKKVAELDDKLINLIGDMFATLYQAYGVGLAAPQVGVNLALTVIDISQSEENVKTRKPLTLINPVILDSHGESYMEEGCLSIPELKGVVKRPSEIYVEYMDINSQIARTEFKGFLARVAQHEIDHLNGILYIDYFSKEEQRKIKPQLEKIRKGDFVANYLVAEINNSQSLRKS